MRPKRAARDSRNRDGPWQNPGRPNENATRMSRQSLRFAALPLVLALLPYPAGAQSAHDVPFIIEEGWGSGAGFQQLLVDAVRDAERVVVTEHSNRLDRWDRKGKFDGPYVVYSAHELTPEERARLLQAVESADPQASPGPMCLFTPHHAIELYVDGKRDSTIEICFSCGELRWDAVQAFYPRALLEVFRTSVVAGGLNPTQDWRKKVGRVRRDSPDDQYRDPAQRRWYPGL